MRNLYLRIYENMIEISPLFVSLNNIIYRNNFAKIDNLIINRKNSIEHYKKLSKGNKIKYLNTNEFFNLIFPKFDKGIRNAIGHEDIEYDAFNQKLSFEGREIYLIEYVYNTWICYSLCCIIYEIILVVL